MTGQLEGRALRSGRTATRRRAAPPSGTRARPTRFPDVDRPGRERGGRGARGPARPRARACGSACAPAATAGRATTCATAACCSTSRGLDDVTIDADAMTARVGPGCRGNELVAELARARPVLPGRPLRRRRARRLPAPGRLRLERPRARAGLHERRGDRRRHRRRRARPRRRARERRPAVGRARRRPRLLRASSPASTCDLAAAGGRRQRRLPLPDRTAR